MDRTPEAISSSDGGSIKVGTTGTIGNLMSQELESTNHNPQGSSSGKKIQTPPVSVFCGGAIPKRTQQRNGSGSSRISRNNNTDHRGTEGADKPRYKPRNNGPGAPMLGSEDIMTDRNPSREKLEKKGRTYTAEVVDIKCSNPVSSRLKKLGFSKLSESFA